MDIEAFQQVFNGSVVYFSIERPAISKDNLPPRAADKFLVYVSNDPSSKQDRTSILFLDSRDMATSINQDGEEDILNAMFFSLTLAGYEVFVDDELYSSDNPYKRPSFYSQVNPCQIKIPSPWPKMTHTRF